MKPALSQSQNKELVRILGLRGSGPYEHRSSASFICPMPHHKDDTPSFNINFEKGLYHCFGCGAHGTLRGLVYEKLGKTAEQALGLGSAFRLNTGYESHNRFSLEDKVKSDKEYEAKTNLIVKGVLKDYFQDPSATEYLLSRGINNREASAMHMKYVEEAYCNGSYFQKRLLIPIYNEKNFLINVEARDVTRKHKIKCLYPKDTIKTIYEHWGLDKERPLYIVEGLMDLAVLRSDDFFENSSCIFGTQVTEYQITLLNSFKEIILIPDNDEAGERSIRDLKSRIKTQFSVLKILDSSLKDVGDIPVKTLRSVKDFRDSGGFKKITN